MTKLFLKFQPEHTRKKAFLVPNIRISNPSQNFAITQIRVPLLQIWHYHFRPKIPKQAFLVPDLRIVIFALNFAMTQIRGRRFQI